MAPGNPLVRRRSFSLEEVARHPLVALRRRDYTEYHQVLERIFAPAKFRANIAVDCDSANSMLTTQEAGNHFAIVNELFRRAAGKRLVYRPLANSSESQVVGIARASNGDVTPAGEKFCRVLRSICARLPRRKKTSTTPRWRIFAIVPSQRRPAIVGALSPAATGRPGRGDTAAAMGILSSGLRAKIFFSLS
jgi:hypothetical protein